ncbi:MAG: transglutaminase domain-containing protein [Bellilinea sp.]
MTRLTKVLYTKNMLTNEKRWWDILSAVLLLSALITVAYRLADTKWTDNLNLVIGLTFIAAVLGFALGYSRFSSQVVGLFGFLFTIFFVTWQLAELTPDDYIWLERLWLLGDRIGRNLDLFLGNQPLNDSILFLANMVLLFWLLALSSAYQLTRYGKPWQGLIITGIALVVVDLYHPPLARGGVATAFFAVLSLLLVSRLHYLKRAREWEKNQVSVDPDTGFNLMRSTLVVVVMLVFLAWRAPGVVRAFVPHTPERQRMIESLQSLRERFQNATAPLRGSAAIADEFYADEFALGTGSVLTDTNIFSVKPSITQRSGVPFYWRIRSYDTYNQGRWESTLTNLRPLTSTSAPVEYPGYSHRLNVRFDFHPLRNLSMVYVPGLPIAINRNVQLVFNGTNNTELEDVITVLADPDIEPGDTYQVTSFIAAPTIASMREAGESYPAWVTEQYLQLPNDLPESIPQLAAEITAGLDNPYDKTAAITQWLRENIQYSATIPQPPPGRDAIEWVLFEHRQAFCNYYATAQVLMLRSLGIPARWVIGYAQGFFDAEEGVYRVRDKDRHAWPEVFFPGLGWIEFEPTAFQLAIDRPAGGATENPALPDLPNTNLPQLLDDFEEATRFDEQGGPSAMELQTTPLLAATLIILGVLVGAIAFFLYGPGRIKRRGKPQQSLPVFIERALRSRGWRIPRWLIQWSLFNQLSPIERSYYSIGWMNRIMGVQIQPAWTPAEHIQALVRVVPECEYPANQLLEEYQKAVYSPHPPDNPLAREASSQLWRQTLRKRGKMFWANIWGASS